MLSLSFLHEKLRDRSKNINILFDICDIHILKFGCSTSKCLNRDLLRDLYEIRLFFWGGGSIGAAQFS